MGRKALSIFKSQGQGFPYQFFLLLPTLALLHKIYMKVLGKPLGPINNVSSIVSIIVIIAIFTLINQTITRLTTNFRHSMLPQPS